MPVHNLPRMLLQKKQVQRAWCREVGEGVDRFAETDLLGGEDDFSGGNGGVGGKKPAVGEVRGEEGSSACVIG